MIEAGLTFLMVLGILTGSYVHTEGFIATETLNLVGERVEFAALATATLPEGGTEIDTTEMEIVDEDGPEIHYMDETQEIEIRESEHTLESVEEKQEFETLCLEKEDQTIKLDPGDC